MLYVYITKQVRSYKSHDSLMTEKRIIIFIELKSNFKIVGVKRLILNISIFVDCGSTEFFFAFVNG